MAYVSQDLKKKIAPSIKAVLKKYKVKGTIAVRHHSTLVVNLKEGQIDFIENFLGMPQRPNLSPRMDEKQIQYLRDSGRIDVNPYWYHEHFSGKAKAFLTELFAAMKPAGVWYDRSDAMVDYFDTAYYVDVNVGKYGKPYVVVA